MKTQTRMGLAIGLALALLAGLAPRAEAGTVTMTNNVQIGNPIVTIPASGTNPYLYDFLGDSLAMAGYKLYYNAAQRNVVLTNLAALTDSGAGVIDTRYDADFGISGYVSIYAASSIQVGGYIQTISKDPTYVYSYDAGAVVVSAASIAIGSTNTTGLSIDARGARNGGPVTLITTGAVTTAGGIGTYVPFAGLPGSIVITDGAGGPAGAVNINGSLAAYVTGAGANTTARSIEVRGRSIGVSNNVLALSGAGYLAGGTINLLAYGGAVTVGGYLQSYSDAYYKGGGPVTLSGTSVTIAGKDANGRSVDSSATRAGDGQEGGAISITASNGNITVEGGFCAQRGNASYSRGNLTLMAANGSVRVGSLDAGAVNQIKVQAGAGTYDFIHVTGVLTNFTVSESPTKKFTFPTAGSTVSNDIYYSLAYNGAGLTGEYAIYVTTNDTGKKLKPGPPPSPLGTPAAIMNLAPTNVTGTGATFRGFLDRPGDPASAVSVAWGERNGAAGGGWSNTNGWSAGAWGAASYPSTNILTLTAGRNYFYTFGAQNVASNVLAENVQYLITGSLTPAQGDGVCGESLSDTATISISRPSDLTNGALAVNYALSGAGTAYVSASPASGFTLAAGQASTNVVFTPVRPNLGAPADVVLTLLPGLYRSDALGSATCTVVTAVAYNLTAASDTSIGTAMDVIENPPDTVTVAGAGNTYTYDFWTSSLNLSGKRIYYAGTRNVVLTNLAALTDSGTGRIDTSTTAGYVGGGGVTVHAPGGIAINGANAGGQAIDCSSISANSYPGGAVTLIATGAVALTAGGIRTQGSLGGQIWITDGAGGPAGNVTVAGDLNAYSSLGSAGNDGSVQVRGNAVAIASNVVTAAAGTFGSGKPITLIASGALTVGGYLAAQQANTLYPQNGGAVTLTGATVTVSGTANGMSIQTFCPANYNANVAGNIRVTATAGDLTLAGGLDAGHPTANSRGSVILAAPSGRITVGSLDAARFKTISIQAGTGTYDCIYVTGVLTNFTVSEPLKRFTFPTTGSAVSNDIYYSLAYNGVGLSGTYDIYVTTNDTGKKLKQGPPPSPFGTPAAVVNLAPTNVTGTGATFRGFLDLPGDPTATVYVVWGENNGAAGGGWSNTNGWIAGAWGAASYPSTNILTLTAGRNYFYTFGAQNVASNVLAENVQYLITGSLTPAQGDGVCGESLSDTATISISRPSDLTNGALAVNYALSGAGAAYVSASPASGFTLAAGQTSTNVLFKPVRPNPGAPVSVTLTLLPGAYPSDGLASDSITVATAVAYNLTAASDTSIGTALDVVENPPDTVTVAGAGNTYTYDFWASSLNLSGKRIYYAGTRSVVLTNLAALTDSGMGRIDTSTALQYVSGGGVTVHAPGGIAINGANAAGQAIDGSSTFAGNTYAGGAVTLLTTGGVSLAAGGIRTQGESGGQIWITDGAGGSAGNVTVAGDLNAYSSGDSRNNDGSVQVRGNTVAIAGNVVTAAAGTFGSGKPITLIASGALMVGGYLAAQQANTLYPQNGGAVTLTGATVTVRGTTNGMSIQTGCAANYSGNVAGDIRVTATAGDLTLAGGVDAWHPTANSRGSIVLSAPNGMITVGSLDASRFKTLTMLADSGKRVYINGVVTNFNLSQSPNRVTLPAGSAVSSDIYYRPASNTVIPLSGRYHIFVAGTDTGWVLREWTPQGTVLLLQ